MENTKESSNLLVNNIDTEDKKYSLIILKYKIV